MYVFGSGLLWGTPTANADGTAIANPTPLLFGTLQDTEIDIKYELKQLHGQNQFAVAVGRGKGTVTGKAKMASLNAGFLETLVFGTSGANGLTSVVYDTTGAAIPATPFQITVAPPSSGTFAADLGVIDASSGRPMTRVASTPAAGQYAVNTTTGQYTFAAADTGKTVYINYRYTATSSTARRITMNNRPMGYAPTFRADFYAPFDGQSAIFTFNKCISDGFKMANKNDDFGVPELGFTVFADAAGVIGTISLTD